MNKHYYHFISTHTVSGLWTLAAERRSRAGRRCGSSARCLPELKHVCHYLQAGYVSSPSCRQVILPGRPLWISLRDTSSCLLRWSGASCRSWSQCISQSGCCCRSWWSWRFRLPQSSIRRVNEWRGCVNMVTGTETLCQWRACCESEASPLLLDWTPGLCLQLVPYFPICLPRRSTSWRSERRRFYQLRIRRWQWWTGSCGFWKKQKWCMNTFATWYSTLQKCLATTFFLFWSLTS